MGYKTCDWCGRSYKPMFSADRDAGNALADAMGLGLITKAIGGAARLAGKRNFCSQQCKLAYEQSKGGGQSSEGNEGSASPAGGGFAQKAGGLFGGMFSSVGSQMQDTVNQRNETRTKTDEVIKLKFASSSDEIQEQLQNLFAQISSLPKMMLPEQKALYNAIKEKLEFGIMKLKSSGSDAEADFFQKKFDKLK